MIHSFTYLLDDSPRTQMLYYYYTSGNINISYHHNDSDSGSL